MVFLTRPCLHNVVQNNQRDPIVWNGHYCSLMVANCPAHIVLYWLRYLNWFVGQTGWVRVLTMAFVKKQIQPGLGTDCSGPVCHSQRVQTKLYSAVTGANIRSDGCFYEKTGHVQWFLQRDALLQNCVFMKSSLGRLIDLCCIQHETDKIC